MALLLFVLADVALTIMTNDADVLADTGTDRPVVER
jgi:hypothetical protein